MTSISGVISPSEGDIYHFETLAELDDYIEYEDTGQAKQAKTKASYRGLAWGVALIAALMFLNGAIVSQLLLCAIAAIAGGSYYLFQLLELCDD